MVNALQTFNYKSHNVRTINRDGDVWFVAKDVCDILEIANARDAVSELDDDEKMTVANTDGHSGKRGGAQFLNLISEAGLYALIFKSRKPEAKDFSRWVRHEVLPAIRKTGSYSLNPQSSQEDLKAKLRDLDLKGAAILQSIIDKNLCPMTPETRAVFSHEILKLVSGQSYLPMLPETKEQWFTASQIGKLVGLSANKVGRIASEYGLKPEQGQSNEFGKWIISKAKHCCREVPTFIYNANARDWFVRHFG